MSRISLVCSALNEMGYKSLMIKPCPWFDDKPFEEVEWYCLMAQKPQNTGGLSRNCKV